MEYAVRNHRLAVGTKYVDFEKSPNTGGVMAPVFLVIHYTASGPSSDIAAYFKKPSAKVSAHLVIRRDGTIVQCVPFDTVAWHAGESKWVDKKGNLHSGLNRNSIGIEIENWGPLKKTGAGYVSWTGQPVDASNVTEARHKFGTPNGGWEVFTEAQVDATIAASLAICETYGIGEIVGHDDISPGRKSDPGPAWAMNSFKAKVLGRSNNGAATFVVRSPTGLNVRTGPAANFPLEPGAKLNPLPDGSIVAMIEADGNWRYVSVLDKNGTPSFSGWVHGGYLFEV